MYSNLNPRTMGLNQYSFEELLTSASKNGFQGIEVPADAFGSVSAAKEAGKRLESLGMKWGLIMAPCDMYKVDDQTFENAVITFGQWAERAGAAGCTRAYNHIWPGSDTRDYDENFEWHHKRLNDIYHVLKESGISYGLEFMGAQTVMESFKYPFIRTVSGTMALADSVNREIGMVFDTIHWYTSGSKQDDLNLYLQNMNRVINLHLNDACPARTREQQIDRERAMPNEFGVINSTKIVQKFHQAGYAGPVIIEPMAPTTIKYENMPLDDAVSDAIQCLQKIFKDAEIINK